MGIFDFLKGKKDTTNKGDTHSNKTDDTIFTHPAFIKGRKKANFEIRLQKRASKMYAIEDDLNREGLSKCYYENGQLEEEINFKDGKGLWKFYYENGQLNVEGNFKDSRREGLWKFYYENGQLELEGLRKADKREGLWKRWWENGQLRFEGNWKDGVMTSEIYYDENGNKVNPGLLEEDSPLSRAFCSYDLRKCMD